MPRSYRNRNDRAGAERRICLRTKVASAAKTGHFAGVQVAPEDLLQRLGGGNTLAHIAANNGKLPQLVEAILAQAGVPIKNDKGKTICELSAAYMNHLSPKPKAKKASLNGRRPQTIEDCAAILFNDIFGGKLPPGYNETLQSS